MSRKEEAKENKKAAPPKDDTEIVTFSKEQYKKAKENVIGALATYSIQKQKADEAKAAIKTAYRNAGKVGIPEDELKFIVEKLNGYSDEFKANVNHICTEYENEQPYFNFKPSIN